MPLFVFFMDYEGNSGNPRRGDIWLVDADTPQEAVGLVKPVLTEGTWRAVGTAQARKYDVKMNPVATDVT